MQIEQQLDGSDLSVKVIGRLDTMTAPELEEFLGSHLDNIDKLTFDFAELDYISSAGLRVLLKAQKAMAAKEMIVKNVNETVQEVFEVTGFSDIFTIE